MPVERFRWLPTRQPVVLDLWDHAHATAGDGLHDDHDLAQQGQGRRLPRRHYYWTKDREFEKFLDLPRRRPVPFELAVGVDDDGRQRLREHGWRQVDSVEISRDADRYRDYIQRSRGEFTVARDQYVRPNTGWFSDRSACYLAAGRPVITQETGFSKFLPTGRGLFGFRTMDDVLAAVDAIESDYEGHCRAAREIAAEYFAAEKVVGSLMERAGSDRTWRAWRLSLGTLQAIPSAGTSCRSCTGWRGCEVLHRHRLRRTSRVARCLLEPAEPGMRT